MTAIRGATVIGCVVTLAALILELPIHSFVPGWSAVTAKRFARELFVAV